jgi:hypothetical protein
MDGGRQCCPGRLARCPHRSLDPRGRASLPPAVRRAPRPARPGRRRPRAGAPVTATAGLRGQGADRDPLGPRRDQRSHPFPLGLLQPPPAPGNPGQDPPRPPGRSMPGKPKIDWDDPAAKDALVSALVNDASVLVAALRPEDPEQPEAPAVALLALVAGQDAEPAEGSDGTGGRWRIARNVAGDRIISTVDPDARHTRKSPKPGETGTGRTWLPTRRPGISPMRSSPMPRARRTPTPPSPGSSWPGPGTPTRATRQCKDRRPPRTALAAASPSSPARIPPATTAEAAARLAGTAVRSRWPGTVIRPTAPGTCAARSPMPGTGR